MWLTRTVVASIAGLAVLVLVYLYSRHRLPGAHVRQNLMQIMNIGRVGHCAVPRPRDRVNHIFWWLQPALRTPSKGVLLWFQGGPGAPGTFGALCEIGRHYVTPHGTLSVRSHPWTDEYDCLFVDQPVGTGLSYQTTTDGAPVAEVEFTRTSRDAMEQVLRVYLEATSERALVVAGESYAGLYCAHFADVVLDYKRGLVCVEGVPPRDVELRAVLVGDPVLDWTVQMPTYADTLHSRGLVSSAQRVDVEAAHAEALGHLRAGKCRAGFDAWNKVWNDDGTVPDALYERFTGSSFTMHAQLSHAPSQYAAYAKWVRDHARELRSEHVPSQDAALVYAAMVDSGDWCAPSTAVYARLIDAGVDLLIYTCTDDPLLGPPTTEAGVTEIVRQVDGTLRDAWARTETRVWRYHPDDAHTVGYSRIVRVPQRGLFGYVVVRNSGHETPAYQPRAAQDMLYRFLDGETAWDATPTRTADVPLRGVVGPSFSPHG